MTSFSKGHKFVTRQDVRQARRMRFIRLMRPLLAELPVVAENPLQESRARLTKVSELFKISLGKLHE